MAQRAISEVERRARSERLVSGSRPRAHVRAPVDFSAPALEVVVLVGQATVDGRRATANAPRRVDELFGISDEPSHSSGL
jgi:hypothetical protein